MRTKIVATIGPASKSKTKLKKMVEAGLDVGRINFSHGTHESNGELIKNLRQAALEAKKIVGIMADLQGPRIRVMGLDEPLKITEREKIWIYEVGSSKKAEKEAKRIKEKINKKHKEAGFGIDSSGLLDFLKPGDPIFIDNGMMEVVVVSRRPGGVVRVEVRAGGIVNPRKGLNIPDLSPRMPAFTKSDRKNLEFALAKDVDFIAMSFVKTAKNILKLRKLIKKLLPGIAPEERPGIIAKIETRESVKNFDEILKVVDGVMVARGDLAIETPIERIPVLQKEMIKKCLHNATPVIVATQMLESMMEKPRPTRAEITDVANAVIDHTDAIMLSGESAQGKYPVKSIRMMAKISRFTEAGPYDDLDFKAIVIRELVPFSFVAKSAVMLAREMDIKNIIVRNAPLAMTANVSRFRPELKIWHLVRNKNEARRLTLFWGVEAVEKIGEMKGGYVLVDGISNEQGKIEYKVTHAV